MGQFNIGDTVRDPESGKTASVVGATETIRVEWHHMPGVFGVHPASAFELVPRKFKAGDFVRIVGEDFRGEIGIIFEDDGEPEDQDPYWVALYSVEGGEEPFSADELEPWLPLVGERVIEANVDDDDEEGTVIAVGGGSVRVLWDTHHFSQDFELAHLEPVDAFEDEDEDEITVGDEVVYSNGIFSAEAKVKAVYPDSVLVSFADFVPLRGGVYSKDFFSKAA